MLEVNGSFYLIWLRSLFQRAVSALFSIVPISLIVLDEHERIEWVLHVSFDKLLLNVWTALKDVVEQKLLGALILNLVFLILSLHKILWNQCTKVSPRLQNAVNLISDDFIKRLGWNRKSSVIFARIKRLACGSGSILAYLFFHQYVVAYAIFGLFIRDPVPRFVVVINVWTHDTKVFGGVLGLWLV